VLLEIATSEMTELFFLEWQERLYRSILPVYGDHCSNLSGHLVAPLHFNSSDSKRLDVPRKEDQRDKQQNVSDCDISALGSANHFNPAPSEP
jgi:hypothetical protein